MFRGVAVTIWISTRSFPRRRRCSWRTTRCALFSRVRCERAELTRFAQLPDGRVIKVGSERFEAPECMFQPHLVDVEQPGMAGTSFALPSSSSNPSTPPLLLHLSSFRSFDLATPLDPRYDSRPSLTLSLVCAQKCSSTRSKLRPSTFGPNCTSTSSSPAVPPCTLASRVGSRRR